MLNNISWATFFIAIGITATLYYLTIGLLFFRKELQNILSGKQALIIPLTAKMKTTTKAVTDQRSNPQYTTTDASTAQNMPDLDQLEKIINEIRYEVIPKAGDHPTKAKLAILFSNYLSGLNGNLPMTLKNNISALCIKEAAEQCNIVFEEQELQQLW